MGVRGWRGSFSAWGLGSMVILRECGSSKVPVGESGSDTGTESVAVSQGRKRCDAWPGLCAGDWTDRVTA